MISTLSLKVLQRMHDRTITGMLAEVGAKCVSDRTVRNWISKRTTPDPALLEQIRLQGLEILRENLRSKEWPPAERDAFVDGLERTPGFVSGLAFSLQSDCGQYPAAVHLAGQIDLLERALAVHLEAGDVRGAVQTVLDNAWIGDEHLAVPQDGIGADETRRQLREAMSWEELDVPGRILVLNLQLQLLATLDLEFCAAHLPGLEATPVFASLLPRLNPQVDLAGRTVIPATRDLYHYPTRRLLDAIACLRVMCESPARKWPRTIPPAAAMARWLDLAGHEKLASNLPKWRSGRTITAARFQQLWDACFSFIEEPVRPPPPVPMLYATTVFTELFIKGSLAERDMSFVAPDREIYLRWWETQRLALAAGLTTPSFGTMQWMPGLA
jgi:hypothetical protein